MNRAVIVVDMLDEFVNGRLGSDEARATVPVVNSVIALARDEGWAVAYACDSHFPEDPELAVWGEHAMSGTLGARIATGVLQPNEARLIGPDSLDAEGVFAKRTYSAFDHSKLEPWLRQRLQLRGTQMLNGQPADAELVIVGTATHICVAQTAIDAFMRGFRVAIVTDATAAFPGVDPRPWLDHIAMLTGARLITSDELADETVAAAV